MACELKMPKVPFVKSSRNGEHNNFKKIPSEFWNVFQR
jgi:hypothetical protein